MKKVTVIFCLASFFYQIAIAQNSLNIVQFSGMVVAGDSLYGIPGVSIYVTKAGRGTISNELGYFSMPTLINDTVVLSAMGYKKKQLIVPKSDKQSVTMIVELVEDTIYLPIIEIFPYPTEELFKQAFLAMNISDQYLYQRMANNLNPQILQKMLKNSSMSASENQRYTLKNQFNPGGGGNVQGFQPLNPYAWSNLVKSIRKNKSRSKYENYE